MNPNADAYSGTGGSIYAGRHRPANLNLTPGVAALALAGLAPSVSRSANVTLTPGAAVLTLAGSAPTVQQLSGNQTLTPGVGAITLSGFAPTVAQGAAGALNTTVTVNSATTGTGLPFTFGHVFKDGDVGAGQIATASGTTDWQFRALTYWPSGYVRHAIIAGRATWAVSGDKVLTLTTATDPGGTSLTESDLATAMPTASIAAGAFTWDIAASVGTADRVRTVCTGPVMSNFIYRKAVSGSSHLVLWASVRVYKGGNVEIFPWVENGFLLVASPTNDVRSYSVTVGSTTTSLGSIDVKHHERPPLYSGSGPSFSYWKTDPQITPKFNVDYWVSTKALPNFGAASPSSATLDALPQSYSPNTLAGVHTLMNDAGGGGAILGAFGSPAQSHFVTSAGDTRAYKAAIVFGLSGGSWSTHYRDETTNEPIRFSDHPSVTLNASTTLTTATGTDIVPSGGENGTAAVSHQPSFAYLPWLLTANWWFLEEQLFWASWNYLFSRVNGRRGETAYETSPFRNSTGAAGIIDSRNGAYTPRGAAWGLRTLAQALSSLPTSHACYASYKTAWEANTDFYKAAFVDGTFASGWVSPLGVLGEYSSDGTSLYVNAGEIAPGSTAWWGAGYQHGYMQQAWGHVLDLNLIQTTASATAATAVAGHALTFAAGLAGDGGTGNWNWRRFTVYAFPWGTGSTIPVTWYTTFSQALTEYQSGSGGLGSISATTGQTLKRHMSNTDFSAGNTELTYGSIQLGALAYAVDKGVAGASAGWSRITQSSSYSAFIAALADEPSYALAPRAPAWNAGQAVGEWREITGSAPSILGRTNYASSNSGNWIEPWCGMQIDTRTSEVISFASGGHLDHFGNAVYSISLRNDAPAWGTRLADSPLSSIPLQGTAGANDTAYYTDGRPASCHTYFSQQFIEARNRAMRFGANAVSTSGNSKPAVDGFNVATNTFDAAGTYPDLPAMPSAGLAVCKDTTTEDVYLFVANSSVRKWTQATNTWSTHNVGFPPIDPGEAASAHDTSRNRILLLRDSTICHTYALSGAGVGTFTSFTLSGAEAANLTAVFKGVGMVYEPSVDAYFVRTGRATGGKVYRIDAGTGAVTSFTTTGGSSIPRTAILAGDTNENVYGKWLRVPLLNGAIYFPNWTSNGWFLRTH